MSRRHRPEPRLLGDVSVTMETSLRSRGWTTGSCSGNVVIAVAFIAFVSVAALAEDAGQKLRGGGSPYLSCFIKTPNCEQRSPLGGLGVMSSEWESCEFRCDIKSQNTDTVFVLSQRMN